MGSQYTFYTTTFLLMICLGHISLLLQPCVILLMVTQCSKVCITMIYQSSTDRHLGCTNIFVIINNAELNMSLYVCLCALVEPMVRHKSRMVGLLGTPVFK